MSEKRERKSSRIAREPVPWKSVVPVYMIQVNTAIGSMIFAPFLPGMVRNKFGVGEDMVGTASGLILASSSLARFIGSFFVGYLSDRFGRKVMIQIGLTATMINFTVFPFAPNFILAFVLFTFLGSLDGNSAVSSALLADLTTTGNRALAFAYMGASFAIARAMSAGLGSVLLQLAEAVGLKEDPYIVPCMFVVSLNFLSLIISTVSLRNIAGQGIGSVLRRISSSSLFQRTQSMVSIRPGQADQTGSERSGMEGSGRQTGGDKGNRYSLKEGLQVVARDRTLQKLFAAAALVSFANGGLLSMISLFSMTPFPLGGLSMDEVQPGYLYLCHGTVAFFFQVFLIKRILKRIGIKRAFWLGMSLLSTACVFVTFVSYLPAINGAAEWSDQYAAEAVANASKNGGNISEEISSFFMPTLNETIYSTYLSYLPSSLQIPVWLGGIAFATLAGGGFMMALPIITTLTATAAPKDKRGLTQGTSQSAQSLARAFGNFVNGSFFSQVVPFGLPFVPFYVLMICYFTAAVCIGLIPRALFHQLEDGRDEGEKKKVGEESAEAGESQAEMELSERASHEREDLNAVAVMEESESSDGEGDSAEEVEGKKLLQ